MHEQAIKQYCKDLQSELQSDRATEHSYRSTLQNLLKQMIPRHGVINEPKRKAEIGAPDFEIYKDSIPIGYIETKNLGANLHDKKYKEQFDRYIAGLGNIIFTNYIDFIVYVDGENIDQVSIATAENKNIIFKAGSERKFTQLITEFADADLAGKGINSTEDLGKALASKARFLKDGFTKLLPIKTSGLEMQMQVFRKILIKDLQDDDFADMYAQTICYGILSAYIHKPMTEKLTTESISKHIPENYKFIRWFVNAIQNTDTDKNIKWLINNLVYVFNNISIELQEKLIQGQDPLLYFYEPFLEHYDTKTRKERGVYYTPKEVVSFIVRSVDEVLKQDFALSDGLNNSDTQIMQGKEDHIVQILDPACGTGTFLSEIIQHIHNNSRHKGMWNNYVVKHLIPRLHGFELLMAPYVMAYLNIEHYLLKTGFQSTQHSFKVILTNALETSSVDRYEQIELGFVLPLVEEAKRGNAIKIQTPIMVVLGNPPYSGESVNKGDWIMELMQDYKQEPGGNSKLKERQAKFLNDDYVKFLRYGQHFIEKNTKGIVAFINPHSFLDNPTFRGMRWNLLKTYDKIYILDLHGNARKKEKAPDGSKDANVFNIMQGVSINIFVKTGEKKHNQLAQVFHYDIYGSRIEKYDFLTKNSVKTVPFKKIPNRAPMYFMQPKDFALEDEYLKGFSVKELFTLNSVGVFTQRDRFTIKHTKEELQSNIEEFLRIDDDETARIKFNLGEDVRDWKVSSAKSDLKLHYPNKGIFTKIHYRPLDVRYTYYTGKSRGFYSNPMRNVMQHFIRGKNIGLVSIRRSRNSSDWREIFTTKSISTISTTITSLDGNYLFPLYVYTDSVQQSMESAVRKSNLDATIVNKIGECLGVRFVYNENSMPFDNLFVSESSEEFAPVDVLDYIYGVLHFTKYRIKYKEFLKTDFPRVPYPRDKRTFYRFVKYGGLLRRLHLLEQVPTTLAVEYPIPGEDFVAKVSYESSVQRVYINAEQHFTNVPQVVWDFHIGGYQPAQKWLKDRKNRVLTYVDIDHYSKIVNVLYETHKLMQKLEADSDV